MALVSPPAELDAGALGGVTGALILFEAETVRLAETLEVLAFLLENSLAQSPA
jgi:hypothetical protein